MNLIMAGDLGDGFVSFESFHRHFGFHRTTKIFSHSCHRISPLQPVFDEKASYFKYLSKFWCTLYSLKDDLSLFRSGAIESFSCTRCVGSTVPVVESRSKRFPGQ